MADILRNSDGSVAVITTTPSGRLVIAEGADVYTASAALRALVHAIVEKRITKARERVW
jgi:hypothetical protein